jgi:KipI family sensor histidine kinase inhibitor
MTVSPLGDSAVVIVIGDRIGADTALRVRVVAEKIRQKRMPGVADVVPAFGRVAVFFDPIQASRLDAMGEELETIVRELAAMPEEESARTIEIGVCYGDVFGPDLELIAARAGKTPEEAAALHASAEYVVHAIGFAPGFPYLGGLPPELATPRRETPRPRVPPGSVGIGGVQTGIYPLETPGGWNLIGRTPLSLFDVCRSEPSLLRAGDRVTFHAMTGEEFRAAQANASATAPTELPHVALAEAGASIPRATSANKPTPNELPALQILRAGMFTTVQDLGRRGYRAEGVPLSGAADPFALRVANLLVGNDENDAGLEFTLVGPEVKFVHDTVVALGGAEFPSIPRWRPVAIKGGTTLKIGPSRNGSRGYLAVAGGIDVPPVLGSRSTYVRARLGGHQGRRLINGDVLPLRDVQRPFRNHWRIDERIMPRYSSFAVVRVIPGEHAGQFDARWTDRVFKVSTQSDRMGVRMIGDALLRTLTDDLISSVVAPGTIQVPPDGQPIVLLADAQTIGGYPQIAHVIAVDLPVMAQLRPGDEVRFILVTLDDARELIAAQERAIGLLREGLAQKFALR